jgi:hypothetical protein
LAGACLETSQRAGLLLWGYASEIAVRLIA